MAHLPWLAAAAHATPRRRIVPSKGEDVTMTTDVLTIIMRDGAAPTLKYIEVKASDVIGDGRGSLGRTGFFAKLLPGTGIVGGVTTAGRVVSVSMMKKDSVTEMLTIMEAVMMTDAVMTEAWGTLEARSQCQAALVVAMRELLPPPVESSSCGRSPRPGSGPG